MTLRKLCALLPLMIEINLWADKYFSMPNERKEMLGEIKRDKEAYVKPQTKELKKTIIKSDD